MQWKTLLHVKTTTRRLWAGRNRIRIHVGLPPIWTRGVDKDVWSTGIGGRSRQSLVQVSTRLLLDGCLPAEMLAGARLQ